MELEQWIESNVGPVAGRRHMQTLWAGYGAIERLRLKGGGTAILKRVEPGAGSGISHKRKVRSYAVEQAWYRRFAGRCGEDCRVPRVLGLKEGKGRRWFLLEDLDAAGYAGRGRGKGQLEACLDWLAAFHAEFLGETPTELWSEGTYWHLKTRPDEWKSMAGGPLKDAAGAIDAALRGAEHRTFVHGDAKSANFCFGPAGVAAVDFQYVGGGVGVKDLAYLLGAFGPRELGRNGDRAIDRYFAALRSAGASAAVEEEWRELFPLAWADFARFLAGWAPGMGGRDPWGDRQIDRALAMVRT